MGKYLDILLLSLRMAQPYYKCWLSLYVLAAVLFLGVQRLPHNFVGVIAGALVLIVVITTPALIVAWSEYHAERKDD